MSTAVRVVFVGSVGAGIVTTLTTTFNGLWNAALGLVGAAVMALGFVVPKTATKRAALGDAPTLALGLLVTAVNVVYLWVAPYGSQGVWTLLTTGVTIDSGVYAGVIESPTKSDFIDATSQALAAACPTGGTVAGLGMPALNDLGPFSTGTLNAWTYTDATTAAWDSKYFATGNEPDCIAIITGPQTLLPQEKLVSPTLQRFIDGYTLRARIDSSTPGSQVLVFTKNPTEARR
ncbi:MAG: hypothetical protein WCI74_18070, partial [Actinomycetes bacterium]